MDCECYINIRIILFFFFLVWLSINVISACMITNYHFWPAGWKMPCAMRQRRVETEHEGNRRGEWGHAV